MSPSFVRLCRYHFLLSCGSQSILPYRRTTSRPSSVLTARSMAKQVICHCGIYCKLPTPVSVSTYNRHLKKRGGSRIPAYNASTPAVADALARISDSYSTWATGTVNAREQSTKRRRLDQPAHVQEDAANHDNKNIPEPGSQVSESAVQVARCALISCRFISEPLRRTFG